MYHQLLFLFLKFYPFSLFFSFCISFLLPHSPLPPHIQITPLRWFLQYSLTFPSFSLVAAFHSSSLFSSTSDPAISFPILQFSYFFFTIFLIFCCSISTQFSSFISFASFKFIITMITMLFLFLCKFLNFFVFFFLFSSFFFSLLFLFFLFSFFFFPLLFFFISQCDDFLNFPCHFLGAVLPAPALYPSLNNLMASLSRLEALFSWSNIRCA